MQERLKFERERLGYTQEEFAKIGGTTRITQGKYEQGSEPKAGYFSAIYKAGADIFYILTGQRIEGEVLSNEEKFLLDKFRTADQSKRNAALAVLIFDEESIARTCSANNDAVINKPRKSKFFHADVQNVIEGNATINNKQKMK